MFARCAIAPLLLFSYFLKSLGLPVTTRLGRGLGGLLYFCGFRKKIVLANLQLALGRELSPEQQERLAREIFANVGMLFLEIARNFSLSPEQMRRELYLSAIDRKRMAEIEARGQGAIFISAHVANWELLAMGMALHGYRAAVVAKRMSGLVSQALIERQRRRTGLDIIYSGGALEKMKVALRENKFIGFMVDQNITGAKGIRADFFGVPAASIRGLAHLVRETGVPVFPFCTYRRPDGTHEVRILEELPYLSANELPENSKERELREEWLNTQQYQYAVEKLIRNHPEQWLWIHRRWKADRSPLDHATAHQQN